MSRIVPLSLLLVALVGSGCAGTHPQPTTSSANEGNGAVTSMGLDLGIYGVRVDGFGDVQVQLVPLTSCKAFGGVLEVRIRDYAPDGTVHDWVRTAPAGQDIKGNVTLTLAKPGIHLLALGGCSEGSTPPKGETWAAELWTFRTNLTERELRVDWNHTRDPCPVECVVTWRPPLTALMRFCCILQPPNVSGSITLQRPDGSEWMYADQYALNTVTRARGIATGPLPGELTVRVQGVGDTRFSSSVFDLTNASFESVGGTMPTGAWAEDLPGHWSA